MKLAATRAVLLRRRGLVFVEGGGAASVPEDHLKALEIEWAALGYVPSTRLRARLGQLSLAELGEVHRWVCSVLARQLGADRVHEPLFRSFPDGIPADTAALWVKKVLSHFLQEIDQPCLFCGAIGTTHVLDPCWHVVCDRCFDGASYSACPVCEHKVDRASPFFQPSPARAPSPKETVTLERLDLGEDPEAQTRALLLAFCDRKQAMSPNDRHDLETIVLDLGDTVLGWLPEKIPVKENVALVFGTLFTVVDPAVVLPVAQQYLKTATDVLRFLAVLSGADASLLPRARIKLVGRAYVSQKIHRFPMAKLARPLRRALLALMEGFGEEALTEDMLRHRSFWVWAGEFLHPHEYAKRFPKVARAFQVVRKYAPDGARAPAFAGFKARLEAVAAARDAPAMVALLRDRPGELGRRLDHALRIAGKDERAITEIVRAFDKAAPRLSTPLLLGLYRYLPARSRPVARRVYWPKGAVTTGFWAPDDRPPLSSDAIGAATGAVTAELLRRFGEKPALDTIVIDEALRQ
ncbi:MAG TPA: RING finger family 4 domain-containing protein, partial [Haliangium sp.]|nr:RING finger family 4 domain-containing protein [Haliangium sp.]